MKSTRILWLIVGLMTVALLGLVALQVYWVRTALDLKERQFSLSVQAGLQSVASRLEAREARATVSSMLGETPADAPASDGKRMASLEPLPAARPMVSSSASPAPQPAVSGRVVSASVPQVTPGMSARGHATTAPLAPGGPLTPIEVTSWFESKADVGEGAALPDYLAAQRQAMGEWRRSQFERIRATLESQRGDLERERGELEERRSELRQRRRELFAEREALQQSKPQPSDPATEWTDWSRAWAQWGQQMSEFNQHSSAFTSDYSAVSRRITALDQMLANLSQEGSRLSADLQQALVASGLDAREARELTRQLQALPPTPPVPARAIGPKGQALSLADSICSETEAKLRHEKAKLQRVSRGAPKPPPPPAYAQAYTEARSTIIMRSDSIIVGPGQRGSQRVYVNVEPNFAVPVNGEFSFTTWGTGSKPTTHLYRAAELDASTRALQAARDAMARRDHARTEAELNKLNHKLQSMRRAVNDLLYNPRPVPARIDTSELYALLREEFAGRGIETPFELALHRGKPTATLVSQRPTPSLGQATYAAELFANDLQPQNYHLVVQFPRQSSYIYQTTGRNLAVSAAFILIICLTFAYTVRTILHQKKLSEMKTDFINNMTHEFKTPIATISLAAEALRESRVHEVPEKRDRFMSVIQTENKRLQSQVERVLQMAEIERGTVRLNKCSVDACEILTDAIAKLSMQVEKRGGSIDINHLAKHTAVLADPMHLGNIFFNLLDNANKYSRETPQITVTTASAGNTLRIAVQDNGIGMNEAQQRRIFESFYRVPTGNLHDVKGFGLGLAYVKTMVEAHGGSVEVRSELGKGSRFDIVLPLLPPAPPKA